MEQRTDVHEDAEDLLLALAKMAQMTTAFPDKDFSGIGGVSTFDHAMNYFLLGCGTVQVCTAAMLDHAVGPNVIRELKQGMTEFLERGTSIDAVIGHQLLGMDCPTLGEGGQIFAAFDGSYRSDFSSSSATDHDPGQRSNSWRAAASPTPLRRNLGRTKNSANS